MDPTRRKILKTGAAATVVAAAAPGVFAQQGASKGPGSFYERGPVRIYYEESGAGFPLMLIAGGVPARILGSRLNARADSSPRAVAPAP